MANLNPTDIGQLTPLLLTSKVCDTQYTQAIPLITNYNYIPIISNNNKNGSPGQHQQHIVNFCAQLPPTSFMADSTSTTTVDNQFQVTYDESNKYHLTMKQSTFSLPLITQVVDGKNPFPTFQQILLYPGELVDNNQQQQHQQLVALVSDDDLKETQISSLPSGLPIKSTIQRTLSLPDFRSSLLNITTEPEVKPNLIQLQSTKKCQQSAQNRLSNTRNHQFIVKSVEIAQNPIPLYHRHHQNQYNNSIEQQQLQLLVTIDNQQQQQKQQLNQLHQKQNQPLDTSNVVLVNQQQQQQHLPSTKTSLPAKLILNQTFLRRTISLPDLTSLMNMKAEEPESHLNLTQHHHHQAMSLNFNLNTIQKPQHDKQMCNSDDKQQSTIMMTTDDMCTNNMSMDKNKQSLKVKLMLRRPIQQLIEQGIIPPPKQSPGIYEQSKKLERARTEDFLKHKIQRRPDRQALIEQHILEDTTVSPTIHNKQRQLKKARLTDDLNDRLSHRPGPLELVKGNILLTDGKFAQAVKEGQIQFKATSEGEPIKHPPPRFIIEEETSSDDSVSPPLSTQSMVNNDSANTNNTNNNNNSNSQTQQLMTDTFSNNANGDDSGPLSIPMTTPLSLSTTTNNNNINTFERLSTISTSNNYFNQQQPQQQGVNCINHNNNTNCTLNFGQGINLIQSTSKPLDNNNQQTLALGTFNCIPLATTTIPPPLSTVFPTFTSVTSSNVNSNNNQSYPSENAAITFNSQQQSTTTSSAFSNTILSSSSPSSSSTPTTTTTSTKETGGPILTKNRKKSKSKSQPKTKTIKFHEYKGPPSAQKNQSSTNCNTESSYELLLKQQQLFLQWQLEWQNKYPPIILPSSGTQKNNTDQVSISNGNCTSAVSTSSASSTSNSYKNNSNSGNAHNSTSVSTTSSTTSSASNNNNNGSLMSSTTNNNNNLQENSNNTNNINNIVTFGNSSCFNQPTNSVNNNNSNTNSTNSNADNCVNNNNPITSIMITTSTRPTTSSTVEINGSHNNQHHHSNKQIISNQHHHQQLNSFVVCGINSGSKNNTTSTNMNINNFNDNGNGNVNNNSVNNNINGTVKIILKLEDMKVSDLKCELKKRNLPVSGSKPQLIERLKPFIESPMVNNNGFNNSTNQSSDDNNKSFHDDPMSPNNNNSVNNGMVIDDNAEKFKVEVKSSVPTAATPMELDPIVYTNIQVSDFQNKPTNRQQQHQHQQQQQSSINQPSFQLQFQNPPVFSGQTASVTIPLSALANQLQIVTTPTTPSTTTSVSTTYNNNRDKLTYTTNNNQGNNLSAIISPGNASAQVKANLAAFLHQHAQQQKTLHLQLQSQTQPQHHHHHQQQQLQQQQQSNQLQGTIGSSLCLSSNQLPITELPLSDSQQQFSSTPLLLTSKVCDNQFNQQQTDHHAGHNDGNNSKIINTNNQQQIQQQQAFETQQSTPTGIANFNGDNHFQVTSDGSNKYHLAIKQSTFSLPLLTQVIDSKNPFPTFHQFLLYPSSSTVNQQPNQPQSQQQQQQQQQHPQTQPMVPNICRLKQTRTNSLPNETATKSISQRTSSLPDFSSLLNITTEPEVNPNLIQSQSTKKCQQSAQNHQSHLPHHPNKNQSILKSEDTVQSHLTHYQHYQQQYHSPTEQQQQQLNLNNQQKQLIENQKQLDTINLEALNSQLQLSTPPPPQLLPSTDNNSIPTELSFTENLSQRTISLPEFSSSPSESDITATTTPSVTSTITTPVIITTSTSPSTITTTTTTTTSSFVSAYPTISSEEITCSASKGTSSTTVDSNDLDEKMDGIDLLFNDLLDFQGSPMNVDYGHWLTEIISDNNPFKLSSNNSSTSSSLPFNSSNINATSMDHDPVLANSLAESCHYNDTLLDLYFDTENLTDHSLA